MGKLNIAHHKSYHPYRRDNIERVRRDEEEARLKEEKEEGRIMLADAEARIDLLRQRAGVSEQHERKKKRPDDDMKLISSSSSMQAPRLPTTNGHINLFEDLEQTQRAIVSAIKVSKKATSAETDKGVPLAPTPKDLKPWYAGNSRDLLEVAEGEEEDQRQRREEYRKSAYDPLSSITKELAAKAAASTTSRTSMRTSSQRKGPDDRPPEVQARHSRESSERMRAMELIRRKKREMKGNSTPSAIFGDASSGYGDVYNRREVEEAHKHRRDGGYGHRKWDDDDRPRDRWPRQW